MGKKDPKGQLQLVLDPEQALLVELQAAVPRQSGYHNLKVACHHVTLSKFFRMEEGHPHAEFIGQTLQVEVGDLHELEEEGRVIAAAAAITLPAGYAGPRPATPHMTIAFDPAHGAKAGRRAVEGGGNTVPPNGAYALQGTIAFVPCG